MSRLIIKHANCIALEKLHEDQAVILESGKIVWRGFSRELAGVKSGDEIFDAKGMILSPGLIDLHIHGCLNYLVDRGPEDLKGMCLALPQFGVTGFLPTVCPLPVGKDAEFLNRLAKIRTRGAAILGFHVEGPHLALTGALPKEATGKPDAKRIEAMQKAVHPHRVIFSIAPDVPDIGQVLPLMANGNTPIFITHTQANVEQTRAAIEAGARHATHFYDVFPVPEITEAGVRSCGAVEAILADPRVSVDFILDGIHVHPVAIQMAMMCKPADKVCLITDANIGAGLRPGRYPTFNDYEIEIAGVGMPARYTEKSPYPHALAGGGLTMNLAVKNAVEMLGISLPRAVRLASANPAQVRGLGSRKGQIEAGFDADLVLMTPSCEVLRTWIRGECYYQKMS